MSNFAVLLPMVIYLGIVYWLAVYSNRIMSKSKGGFIQEYFIGSREMGGFVLALTLVATYTSASSFIGGPGVAYKMGLGWVLLAMIQLPTAFLTLGVLGKKFAIVARKINAVTINDFLWERYKNKGVVILGSVSLILFFIAAMVAQFIGGARLFEAATGLSYNVGLAIFAVTVIIYTTVGGFRAVVLTDALQGIVMVIGTLALLIGIVNYGGGMANIINTLKATDPALITPFGPNNFISKPYILSFWVLVGFGVIGLPHTAVRCMGYKDSQSMHRAMVIGTFVVGFLMLGMHLAGVLGKAIIPDVTVGDLLMPQLTLKILPPVVAGLFLAGPLAAIMSTIDSQLILASAAIVKDLYLNYINPGIGETEGGNKQLQKISFYSTALIGIIVFLAAIKPPELIVWINLFAFGGLEAAFLWPTVLGLYWKRANAAGALASMATGIAAYIYFDRVVKRFMGMHIIVPVLLIALIVFVVVSLVTKKPEDRIIERFWGA
ncbi:Sodium/pantothenate symporter [Koleobacter methoxysyntrophicus]|jgi:sodium/pantothenate symporter|uniref:Sodium/pantothenate symporter n=1 Tax=Koleobacter methoxysyntrophicus TaxID=2751313 RepID=A0A8A0RNW4_9FIRM|nr:sodium/pantothenate symporter [Koleobacter methoxysyntrophicus]NPV43905.1 sodium/pantothenate symporter [Bacillota bacterium]QSQ09270.1 Sodium/pantothenate symporter [Koleobacter methoxysyntrophicus]